MFVVKFYYISYPDLGNEISAVSVIMGSMARTKSPLKMQLITK